jgi:hypothetical protein
VEPAVDRGRARWQPARRWPPTLLTAVHSSASVVSKPGTTVQQPWPAAARSAPDYGPADSTTYFVISAGYAVPTHWYVCLPGTSLDCTTAAQATALGTAG